MNEMLDMSNKRVCPISRGMTLLDPPLRAQIQYRPPTQTCLGCKAASRLRTKRNKFLHPTRQVTVPTSEKTDIRLTEGQGIVWLTAPTLCSRPRYHVTHVRS